MIRLDAVSQIYRASLPIFSDVSIDIPSNRKVALLGASQSGKTTLIQMLAGLISPSSGSIFRSARLSFPAGYQRGFRLSASVRQNLMFAAQIYDADEDDLCAFVSDAAELEPMLDAPLKDLAAQERVNLSFALTYALPFDTYLFDNTIGTGDARFRSRCEAMYDARAREAGMIVATRFPRIALQLCDCALVIGNHGLTFFDNVEAGVAAFNEQVGALAAAAVLTPSVVMGDAHVEGANEEAETLATAEMMVREPSNDERVIDAPSSGSGGAQVPDHAS